MVDDLRSSIWTNGRALWYSTPASESIGDSKPGRVHMTAGTQYGQCKREDKVDPREHPMREHTPWMCVLDLMAPAAADRTRDNLPDYA